MLAWEQKFLFCLVGIKVPTTFVTVFSERRRGTQRQRGAALGATTHIYKRKDSRFSLFLQLFKW